MESPRIGIVGGGQLGRMLTLAAIPMGFKIVVLDPTPNCPAAQAGADQIVGGLYDKSALGKLGHSADFITVEIEHLDTAALKSLEAAGKKVFPSAAVVRQIQDKFDQKRFLADNDLPSARFAEVGSAPAVENTLADFGGKMLLKAKHGAYDGRGNALVHDAESLSQALKTFGDRQLYAEEFIDFQKELAIMVARASDGQTATYPVVETLHQRNICVEVRAPAGIPDEIAKEATSLATTVVEALNGVGVFGVEMFLTKDDRILMNEIAPRVHNSGHYTIEACRTSQFEQHIRAVTGLPLGSTQMVVPAAAMVNILGERDGDAELQGLAEALALPAVSVHIYGKSPTKIDRKMGHITATADTLKTAIDNAEVAREKIRI